MKTTTADSNGRTDSSPVFTPRPLPAHDADEQIHRRGSAGSARTHLDKRCFADLVISGFSLVLQHLRAPRPKPVDIDGLDSQLLAKRVTEAIQANPLVVEASANQLQQRLKLIQDLHAGRPTRIARQVAEQSETLVEECARAIISHCSKQAEVAPYGVDKVVNQVEEGLAAINYPDPDSSVFPRYRSLVESIQVFEHPTDLLPPHKRERVLAALRKHAADTFEQALASRCLHQCNEQVRCVTDQLRSSLADIKGTVTQLRIASDEVRKLLEAKRSDSYRLHAVSASSNLLRLDGQDERELLAGLKARLNVDSSAELAESLVERLVDRLGQVARERYPLIATPVGISTLLARIAPADTAEALEDVLRELVGDSHSVYASIRTFGTKDAASELLQRASPLCRLRSRNHPIFGVETALMTVVRLPEPLGPEDQQTYRDLCDLFEKETNLRCIDAPATECDITIVQTIIGFPIAIDSNQETLLEYYATSESIHHLPHLFGVIPECEGGGPLAVLKALFEELDTEVDDAC